MELKHITALSIISLSSCSATPTFPYRHYGLHLEKSEIDEGAYRGVLQGPEPKDDIELSKCEPEIETNPTTGDKELIYRCFVYPEDEHFKLKENYKKLKQRLQSCEEQLGE